MGSPGGRVCKALCGLCSAFCSQSARRRLRTGRAHMLAWGTPRNARLAWDAQGDVVAARMVGIQQEGNPCQMVPSEKGRGARSANSCHDVTGKGARAVNCRAGECNGKKRREKQASPLRVNRIPGQGVEDPLVWAQEGTS